MRQILGQLINYRPFKELNLLNCHILHAVYTGSLRHCDFIQTFVSVLRSVCGYFFSKIEQHFTLRLAYWSSPFVTRVMMNMPL